MEVEEQNGAPIKAAKVNKDFRIKPIRNGLKVPGPKSSLVLLEKKANFYHNNKQTTNTTTTTISGQSCLIKSFELGLLLFTPLFMQIICNPTPPLLPCTQSSPAPPRAPLCPLSNGCCRSCLIVMNWPRP